MRLHVLVINAQELGVAAAGRRAGSDIVDVLDDALDLTIAVGPVGPSTQKPHHWDDLIAPIRPGLCWADRLKVSCPRLDDRQLVEPAESGWAWIDPTQDEFAGRATERGWQVEASTPEQGRREHRDLQIRRGDKAQRVDVKGRSRVRRGDAEPQDAWHWVEQRGVVDDGWLLGGQADLIAFRMRSSFVLVLWLKAEWIRDLEPLAAQHFTFSGSKGS